MRHSGSHFSRIRTPPAVETVNAKMTEGKTMNNFRPALAVRPTCLANQ